MSVTLRLGDEYRFFDASSTQHYNELSTGTYKVSYNEVQNYFMLKQIDDYEAPKKLYGDTVKKANRIIDTYLKRGKATGVLLEGLKGSGKTLLAKMVSIYARERNIPTIIVSKAYCGDHFNQFIQQIGSRAIVLFDEFEKTYDYKEQQQLLTLLDGAFPTDKLFMFTINEVSRIDNYFKNRPGRIYYSLNFDRLSEEFIDEYARDNLNDIDKIPSILKYAKIHSNFNFDMLSAIIEEMNRYGEDLNDVLMLLNVTLESNTKDNYSIVLYLNDKPFTINSSYTSFDPNKFEYYLTKNDIEQHELLKKDIVSEILKECLQYNDDFLDHILVFTSENLVDYDFDNSIMIYKAQGIDDNQIKIRLNVSKNKKQQDFDFFRLVL